jgi:hypothetical protein
MRLMAARLAIALCVCLAGKEAIAVSGSYEGGFASQQLNVKVELRCDTAGLCEVALTESVGGVLQPTKPLQRFPLRPLRDCVSGGPQREWEDCDPADWNGVADWKAVRGALKFARENREYQPIGEVRQMLKPLLESQEEIGACYRFEQWTLICELVKSPWNKPVLLYLLPMMEPCHPPTGFCSYRFVPLFKTSEAAILRAQSNGFLPLSEPWKGPPATQWAVADYVKDLEAKIRAATMVPSGAPSTARVAYQIQFSQESGRIYSVNRRGGCYCPSLWNAVNAAIQKIQPLPILPKEQHAVLGGRNGRVELETKVGLPEIK